MRCPAICRPSLLAQGKAAFCLSAVLGLLLGQVAHPDRQNRHAFSVHHRNNLQLCAGFFGVRLVMEQQNNALARVAPIFFMQRLQQAEVVGQHRRNRIGVKINVRVKARRIVDVGQSQCCTHHHRVTRSQTIGIQLRRVCTLPCQLCQSNHRLPINCQQFRCVQEVGVCTVKLCTVLIADKIVHLNDLIGSALGIVDGLGLLFFVTDERADHRAVRGNGQQVGVALVGTFKGQQGVALLIAGCIQQLLAVQALADGVNAGGVEKMLHFVHGKILPVPVLGTIKISTRSFLSGSA
nr:MAG TPA: hypothetical protein [Caudoviricetes sp.]